jgi:hypothetical protein
VVSALFSRFCQDLQDFALTCHKYAELGVSYYSEGDLPYVCLKSAKDQHSNLGEFFPKGKFLKSISFREPEFYEYEIEGADTVPAALDDHTQMIHELQPTPVAQQMADMRTAKQVEEKRKWASIERQVGEYRSKLEREVFGLPPFDANKNSTGQGDDVLTPPADHGMNSGDLLSAMGRGSAGA